MFSLFTLTKHSRTFHFLINYFLKAFFVSCSTTIIHYIMIIVCFTDSLLLWRQQSNRPSLSLVSTRIIKFATFIDHQEVVSKEISWLKKNQTTNYNIDEYFQCFQIFLTFLSIIYFNSHVMDTSQHTKFISVFKTLSKLQ